MSCHFIKASYVTAALYTELSSKSLQKDSNNMSVLSATPPSNDDNHDSGPVPPRKKSKEHCRSCMNNISRHVSAV